MPKEAGIAIASSVANLRRRINTATFEENVVLLLLATTLMRHIAFDGRYNACCATFLPIC